MCSIAGIVVHEPHPPVLQRLTRMLDAQAHRGPDDSGTWTERVGPCRVALANTRLSILDLSADGHQPMVSACGDHILVYNGELYNFVELREELRQLGQATHS